MLNRKIIGLLILLVFASSAFAQQQAAYVIYNSKGRKVSYQKMLKATLQSDIILFGEYHDNPISHWLELEVTKALGQADRPLIMGGEMFETDNQKALNNYFTGLIDQQGLDTMARLWTNYETDYAPLVDYAKENGFPFFATNIPRRYASAVYTNGGFAALDDLAEYEKRWIVPMPFPFDPDLPQYQNILTMMEGHGTPELVKAQAIKDATMAHFILKYYQPGSVFLHFNGSYHCDFYEGILWYLQQGAPDQRYLTITTVEQSDVFKLEEENVGRADFIICVDEDMTNTH